MKIHILLTLIFLGLTLSSCHVTRDIEKAKKETEAKINEKYKDSLALLATYRENYESLMKQFTETGIVFENDPCPPIDSIYALLDSAGKIQLDNILLREKISKLSNTINKLEISADGTIKAEGNIKAYKKTEEKLKQELSNKDATIQELQVKLSEKKTEIKEVIVEKTVHVEKKIFPWWMWVLLPVCAALAWVAKAGIDKWKKSRLINTT